MLFQKSGFFLNVSHVLVRYDSRFNCTSQIVGQNFLPFVLSGWPDLSARCAASEGAAHAQWRAQVKRWSLSGGGRAYTEFHLSWLTGTCDISGHWSSLTQRSSFVPLSSALSLILRMLALFMQKRVNQWLLKSLQCGQSPAKHPQSLSRCRTDQSLVFNQSFSF